MIKINKDKETYTVTKGAYESFYKPLGYSIVNNIIDTPKKVEKNIDKQNKENEGKKTDVKNTSRKNNEEV